MPLLDPRDVNGFHREMETSQLAIVRGIPLPDNHFAVRGPGADLLFKRLDRGRSVGILVDEEVRYIGVHPALRDMFSTQPIRGWRPLLVVPGQPSDRALREAETLLGLNGLPPRVPAGEESAPREIVVTGEQVRNDTGLKDGSAPSSFGVDLVLEAREGRLEPPLFRAAETAALVRILSKEGKNAAVLVGPPGVGKTAAVEGLAVAIARGEVPADFGAARVLDVNLSFLAAGCGFRNEFEGRMKNLLDQARRDPTTILFFDELHTIRNAGGDASQMVKSDLGRGHLRCIGATTNEEFRQIEQDAALARRFQVVPVVELTAAQTVEVLRVASERLQRHHRVSIPDDLLRVIVDLSVRHVPNRHLPDKALDLLDEACACARLEGRPGTAGGDAR